MELKHNTVGYNLDVFHLLIVPYGIETYLAFVFLLFGLLLIVPYGIETCFRMVFLHLFDGF